VYSSQHPGLKHPKPAFLPQCQHPSFTPMQKTGKLSCCIFQSLNFWITNWKTTDFIPKNYIHLTKEKYLIFSGPHLTRSGTDSIKSRDKLMNPVCIRQNNKVTTHSLLEQLDSKCREIRLLNTSDSSPIDTYPLCTKTSYNIQWGI
jgi:hypothetical protein